MRFDWDPAKASSNLKKHKISFEQAITAFDDPFSLIADDEKHSKQEQRFWLIGRADSGGVLVVVFTKRDSGQTTRLISARPAKRDERERYEELTKIPI